MREDAKFLVSLRSRLRLLLTDLDGTLVEFPSAALFEHLGRLVAPHKVEMCSYEAFLTHLSDCEPLRFLPNGCREGVAHEFWNYMNTPDAPALPLVEGAVEALSRVRAAGVLLGMVTARRNLSPRTLEQLASSGLSSLFDGISTRPVGDRQWRGKAEQLGQICEQLKIQPGQTCFVGDIPHDIAAGREAGIGCNIGVLSGGVRRELLEDAGADMVVDSISIFGNF